MSIRIEVLAGEDESPEGRALALLARLLAQTGARVSWVQVPTVSYPVRGLIPHENLAWQAKLRARRADLRVVAASRMDRVTPDRSGCRYIGYIHSVPTLRMAA